MRAHLSAAATITLVASISVVLFGCQTKGPESTEPLDATVQEPDTESAAEDQKSLSVSILSWDGYESLPKQGLAPENYRDLIQEFAKENDFEIRWIRMDRFNHLLNSISNGAADVAVSHITITESRDDVFEFTIPISTSHNWLIGVRADGRLGVAEETAYVEVAQSDFPESELVLLEPGTNPDDVAEAIISGQIDATLMDEAVARSILDDYTSLNKLQELDTAWNYGWLVNSYKPELKVLLDDFIRHKRLEASQPNVKRAWSEIKEAGVLRMITVNGPTTFYLWRGEFVGYDYDLMELFAESQDLRLDPIVANGTEQALEFLREGRGDVVAASLTPTLVRKQMNLSFTNTYFPTSEAFVTKDNAIRGTGDLQGKTVHVNPATSFHENLVKLKSKADFEIVLREGVSTERLIEEVSAGTIEATVADSHMFAVKSAYNETIQSGMLVDAGSGLSWAVRDDQPQLLEKLNEWINQNYRGLEYNLAGQRYFQAAEQIQEFEQQRIRGDVLSKHDRLTKAIAERFRFDWRLITSQMFEESRFMENAVSHAGALGLLQVMPNTAIELGVDPEQLSVPAVGIHTGVRYLDWTRNRFRSLGPLEQQWFALAAYNAGVGHVRDARKLSKKLGLDPDKWFDNVEIAILKLAEPEYYQDTRYGYVRGREPVRYVRNIRDRYEVYLAHFEGLASRTPAD